jgi:hypothetical protein
LFTITSTPPRSRAASTTLATAAGSATSVSTKDAVPPASRIASCVGVDDGPRGSSRTSATRTVAPASPNRRAIARPIPELPPVTTTVLSTNSSVRRVTVVGRRSTA